MKKLTKLLSLTTLIVLTGCNSIYNAPTEVAKPEVAISHSDPQWQQHLAQLQKIKGYSAKGQFGYISPEERFSSHFDWQYKTPTNFGLTMSSNLSSKSLKLQRNELGMTVSDSEGRSRTESDIDLLMKEIIGVSFPIDQFAYWVKGQPEKHSNYIVNEKRQLSQFDYPVNGSVWKATFVEYHEDRQPNLPKLIVLQNGKQTLKIRIDNWAY
ncbi:lipoprotein localization protein LolB [Ursidibacter maritimus]|uniref:Outer-membrane lipoprotein LolB n=1 Tax=Ursidibacter maritimus TaxID=1331689 RepID=A0A949T7M3_9PAST|nr:lipoprotein insertase outer membrane protein LolB [Ursidibacter maritimus]KAE9539101.1 lipoprotein localization factor LolB [Ursidibacter maritimus]MBV6524103.1 lipoprotein localization protein LolB [Ursidibacter maritimus]MBV6526426.1 lipoprotein localization protein LolB [Ursidibacter maritimus]MBV6527050.1 lipoprotein localization protein LolB [Ursidibacter maritimus]MBV6528823.1 lipoprotein localization protein LolB [Ursidibacter maritimus]